MRKLLIVGLIGAVFVIGEITQDRGQYLSTMDTVRSLAVQEGSRLIADGYYRDHLGREHFLTCWAGARDGRILTNCTDFDHRPLP